MTRTAFALLAASLTLTATGVAAQDPNLGRNLAATCANCHGTNGHALPDSALAPLAGSDPARLQQRMKDFRSGARPGTVMPQIARGYTDEEVARIAAYFAAPR